MNSAEQGNSPEVRDDAATGTPQGVLRVRRPGARAILNEHTTIIREGSHVIMIFQPQVVTDHILKAVQALAGRQR